jgi:YidC/Oxa1 family membrane protein insertase
MENQRLLLVIALLFVLFLIWQNWIEFQASKSAPPTVTTAPATPETAPQGGVQSRQDVPSQQMPGVPTPSATQAPGPALSSGQRVRIITDLFEAEIDTLGGDLRHVGLRTYSESLQQKDQPFELLQDNRAELFIIQSGLVSDTGPAPNHYVRYVPEQTEYRLKAGENSLEVPLVWTDESGFKVIKTYTFYRNRFVIDLTHRVENATGIEWRGSQYRQLQRTPPQQTSSWLGGVYTYTGGVFSTPDEPYEKVSFDDMAKEDLNQTVVGGWVAMIQHYFLAALVPKQDQTDIFYTKVVDGNRFVLGMLGQQQTVAPGGSGKFATQFYVGPKIQDRLEELAPNLRLTVDYGFLTVIAQPLFWLLEMIYKVVGNWGWAIVVLTILIKAAFFKLSETSYKSMANMRRLAPKMASLKERYGDDRQRMNQAMMDMYKKEKINPLGGCLPILVQIPVFIALYWMLLESVELRQAPFMLWIQDLSVKDPYYVLPIIMGATMYIQQKLNPPPPDPMQAKVMMALPFVFTFFFLWFPAGLVLYWVVNNVLSIAQQYVITKRVEQSPVKT